MSNSLQATLSQPVAGLGDFEFTVVDAGMYTCKVNTTLPLDSEVELEILLNTDSQFDTGGADDNPTPTQQSIGGSASMECDAGDVIHVVLSSSAVSDNVPNAVKSVVSIYQGF